MAVEISRRLFTREEYHSMAEAGILTEEDRLELIEGEILQMPPISSRHAGGVNRLAEICARRFAGRAIVAVQNPVVLDGRSEPQPDLALLRPRPDFYSEESPGPEDVLWLIEVLETSGSYDRRHKVPLYARAGIPEVWLLDLPLAILEVHRGPALDGYRWVSRHRHGEEITSLAFPDPPLALAELLG